jgi:protein-L-isoaspartate(D-aspartate) O-methyltransferase
MARPRAVLLMIAGAMLACSSRPTETQAPADSPDSERARAQMVEEQIRARDVRDSRVLDAMRRVPREQFVPVLYRGDAYADQPLPIGYGQTISQPYIVAFMTETLQVKPTSRVLEIGTGSGYQAAVLAELAREVYTIEIVGELAKRATETLSALGYPNVHVRHGDGYKGWPEHAPFDGIIVTAAPDHVPQPLIDQLKVGGRLVIPVGSQFGFQQMTIITKTPSGIVSRESIPVRFVPLVREK